MKYIMIIQSPWCSMGLGLLYGALIYIYKWARINVSINTLQVILEWVYKNLWQSDN